MQVEDKQKGSEAQHHKLLSQINALENKILQLSKENLDLNEEANKAGNIEKKSA